jgi:hypothetical protein
LIWQDIDRLQHYGQQYGSEASYDTHDPNLINPAVFFSDDAEANTGKKDPKMNRKPVFRKFIFAGKKFSAKFPGIICSIFLYSHESVDKKVLEAQAARLCS